ncbi:MAG: sulfate transporter, partial [Pseudolabrys sp.]
MHSRRNTTLAFIALFGVTFFSAVQALAQEKSIVVASTTSTQDSGLFEYLL